MTLTAAKHYDELPRQLSACRRYMAAFGLFDGRATRDELVDALSIPRQTVDTFSRYGRLGPAAA